jgi:hypothetical protein
MISAVVSTAFSQKVASTSLQFLKVMPCARATALGDAYSAWATGAEAVFWNPSGVALTEKYDISATFIKWIFDSKQAAISYAMSLGDFGALGLQLQYVDYGSFEETILSILRNYRILDLQERHFNHIATLLDLPMRKA